MESHGSTLCHNQFQTGQDRSPAEWQRPSHSRSSSTASSRQSRQNIKDWEIMDDMQKDFDASGETVQDTSPPAICEGYLMKRRKWHLKGWHKRYFVLEKGILKYSKNQYDCSKGKLNGSIDVSLAVMSVNKKARRIDLDTGDSLYHIKAKNHDLYYIWVTKLSAHRMYKRNEAAHDHNNLLRALSRSSNVLQGNSAMQNVCQNMSQDSYLGDTAAQSEDLDVTDTGVNGKVCAWLQQAQDPDSCTQELNRCQIELNDLNRLVQKLHNLELDKAVSNGELKRIISMQNLSLERPKKKSSRIWGHTHTLGMPLRRITKSFSSSHLGASMPSIPEYVHTQLAPSGSSSSPESKKLYQDICTVSQRVHGTLRSVHEALFLERQRIQDSWSSSELRQNTSAQINICSTLTELDMKSRQTQIHTRSECSDSSEESYHTVTLRKSESICRGSVTDSVAEYFDAYSEICESFSEASDESGLSDVSSNSEPEKDHVTATLKYRASLSKASAKPRLILGRSVHRTTLPAVCPDNSHVGLMTILYNNIGKDLSRVSMPAALNEPVNLLQRLCEELEYSELLDTANRTDDPYQRMVYIAAFAISGYSSAQYRNRYKPFNPVLGETFECVREDRGFRFISEQVCHHPPISACHAVSDNFCFWQDQRWKNKFWGKSLEIMPAGMVNVTLSRYGDHYEWNKVVTCIHNVLSQQRYLEHYGEATIRNLNSSVCTCKITFVKSRYWGSDANKNEVQGQVLDESGNIVHRFGGFWHEGIFCDTLPNPQCIWKPYPQPKDHMLYYGFSNFAMEMNELNPELEPLLPPTDTRLRPDQRMLEEGRVEEVDKKKDEVEEKQRERRKILAKRGEPHMPRFFRKSVDAAGKEVWLTNGTYWKLRENPGFSNMKNLELW
ncbi:oxysterol-binding protein-related protein 7 isoform X1 [Clarias gariepinus]|uniref:oxysterol-binding protein-related protein 7 isoform X1 n=1 Tax=Clarias gariepinus TaxID=13013 RepID=UPI00234CEE0B|nr:oxysterol-binding protein-related protein 7 isoform X1 [Clarias gariepinus]